MHLRFQTTTLLSLISFLCFLLCGACFTGLLYEVRLLQVANRLAAARVRQLTTEYNTLVRTTMEMQLERDAALVHSHVVEVMAGMRPIQRAPQASSTAH